jgi:hypothetical protein
MKFKLNKIKLKIVWLLLLVFFNLYQNKIFTRKRSSDPTYYDIHLEIFKDMINYKEIVKIFENKNSLKQLLAFPKQNIKNEIEYNLEKTNTNFNIPLKNFDLLSREIRNRYSYHLKVLDLTISYLTEDQEVKKSLIQLKKAKDYLNTYFNFNFNDSLKYKFIQVDPDEEPPKPYSSLNLPCMNSGDCMTKKLKWMMCTVKRVTIRTAYEELNKPLLTMSKIIFNLCGCLIIPKGAEQQQIKCTLTTAQPGIPCVISNMVFKSLFKLSFNMWKAYQTESHKCYNPISPYN